jgi:hypothetical protein
MSRAPSPEQDALVRKRLIALAFIVILCAGGVWYLLSRGPDVISGDILTQARFPSALAALPDGTIRYAERLTGEIRDVSPEGDVAEEPLAEVDASVSGQRGLLGVAVDDTGRTFASWTDESEVLLVGQVAPGPRRVIWRGPETSDLNIGGRIAFGPDGRLIVALGDLEDPPAVTDPGLPNGKILALEPDGVAQQQPSTISGGWTNPVAFGFGPDGTLWVADDAPQDTPDRLARGDLDLRRYPITELSEDTKPAGLAAVGDELFLCGFETRRLVRFRVVGDRALREGAPLATNCSLGVIALPDGRLAYSNEGTIFTIDPESPPE